MRIHRPEVADGAGAVARSRKRLAIGLALSLILVLAVPPLIEAVAQVRSSGLDPKVVAPIIERDSAGRPVLDRSKPVPAKSEIINAWQRRQDRIGSFRFAWTEQQVHPNGWLPNPRYPERDWLSIPGLLRDRTYPVSKTLTVAGNRMRYSFQLHRGEEPDGVRVISPSGDISGLGPERSYLYVGVHDGQTGKTSLTASSDPRAPAIRHGPSNVDAQNLDTRAILMAFRPLDSVMGHLLVDRAVPNGARTFYRGKSSFLLEEQHDPSGWKTILTIEPERDFIVSRYMLLFEQKLIVDMHIDYAQDARWGWIPSGWQITEMLADGSRRLINRANVSSYDINQPIGVEQFR